jgi:hypothetical protein
MPDLTLKLELSATAIDSALSSYATRVSTVSIGSTQNAAVFTADSGSGADVWFSSNRSGTTAIDAKLVYWSDGDSEFAFDVEIASVSASTGATIYLQVGDKPVGYGTNPYDASTDGSWPLFEDFSDDTSNGNDLTANGGLTAGGLTGPDGSLPATDFDSASSEYASRTDSPLGSSPANYTLEAWIKSAANGYQWIMAHGSSSDNNPSINIGSGNDNADGTDDGLRLFVRDDAGTIRAGTATIGPASGTAFDDTWNHVAATYTGSTVRVYIDGSEAFNVTSVSPGTTTLNRFAIGAHLRSTASTFFDGGMSGAAMHSAARSAAWLKADYLLQGSSSASYWTDTDVTAVASYYVYNAGTAAVNQWYDLDSFDGNGRPIYLGRTDSDYVLQYSVDQDTFQGAWALEHTSGQYYYFISAAMDPVEDTYTAYLGSAPGAIVATAVPAAGGGIATGLMLMGMGR